MIPISNHMYRTLGKCVPLEKVDFLSCRCGFYRWCIAFSISHRKHKSKYHCLPFYLVTLFLIDTLTLVKHEWTSVCWNYNLLISSTLDLSSVITCKKTTTSGIFSIGLDTVGYCHSWCHLYWLIDLFATRRKRELQKWKILAQSGIWTHYLSLTGLPGIWL